MKTMNENNSGQNCTCKCAILGNIYKKMYVAWSAIWRPGFPVVENVGRVSPQELRRGGHLGFPNCWIVACFSHASAHTLYDWAAHYIYLGAAKRLPEGSDVSEALRMHAIFAVGGVQLLVELCKRTKKSKHWSCELFKKDRNMNIGLASFLKKMELRSLLVRAFRNIQTGCIGLS